MHPGGHRRWESQLGVTCTHPPPQGSLIPQAAESSLLGWWGCSGEPGRRRGAGPQGALWAGACSSSWWGGGGSWSGAVALVCGGHAWGHVGVLLVVSAVVQFFCSGAFQQRLRVGSSGALMFPELEAWLAAEVTSVHLQRKKALMVNV